MIKDWLIVEWEGFPFIENTTCFLFSQRISVNQPSYLHCIASNAELCHGFLCCASQQIKIASLPSRPSKTSLKGRSQLKDQTMGLGPPAWQQYSSNLLSSVLPNLSQLSDLSVVNFSAATLHWSLIKSWDWVLIIILYKSLSSALCSFSDIWFLQFYHSLASSTV